MFNQIESVNLNCEFKDLGVFNKALAARATKDSRAPQVDESDEFEMGLQQQMASSGGGVIVLVGNPLLVMAQTLRTDLHEFVHASLTQGREPRVGFCGESRQVVSPAKLISSVQTMCQQLEDYFQSDLPGLQGLNFRVGAHNLQSRLEQFLIMISNTDLTRDVLSPSKREVLSAAVQLKAGLAEMVIDAQAAMLQKSGKVPDPAA